MNIQDITQSTEIATEMALVELESSAKFLDESRVNPIAYRSMRSNINDIKNARDRLTTLLEQIEGVA
jgi:hypothetical protein